MARSPIKPARSRRLISRSHEPLSSWKGTAAHLPVRARRSAEISTDDLDNVGAWVAHHAGEAYSLFCQDVMLGGTEFAPESDDPRDVVSRMIGIPEGLLLRLDASFTGLEREADPEGYFRSWFTELHGQYLRAMEAALLLSGSDYEKRHRQCLRALGEMIPDFFEFFDELREFIGYTEHFSSCWRTGDSHRESLDMGRFTAHVVWGCNSAYGTPRRDYRH